MIRDIVDKNEKVNAGTYEMKKLKEVIPQCFNEDNTFDMEKFQSLLKGKINIRNEGYGLHFLGKSYARMLASLDTETVITPNEEHNAKSENKDSENIYITGDNLDALKHLLKSYIRKIKCIYIDPPYNTGTDGFVYKDSFDFKAEELAERLSIDEDEAQRVLDLTKRGSASHSAWLTFMYPRLLLARDLLTDDGVIFISIDDNEQANLRLLCDEIFGEENFVADFIWNNKYTVSNDTDVSYQHEHITCFAKNRSNFNLNLLDRTEKQNKMYRNKDNDPKGAWKPTPLHARSGNENNLYEITFPNGVVWKAPTGRYPRYSKERLLELYNSGELYFNENGGIDKKTYLSEVRNGVTCGTFWSYEVVGHSHGNNEELANLMGKGIFNDPKGVPLLSRVVRLSTGKNDIILDFFSGSATTAHAVMDLNAKDNGNRKFIMVQLAEEIAENKPAYKAGYRTIDEIGRERIVRAAKKIREENPDTAADLGFKHYVLNDVSDNVFDTLEEFKPDENLISDNHILNMFGAKTVLTTWLVYDGYGFSPEVEIVKFGEYTAYHCQKHLYFIYDNFDDEAIQALIEKYDGDGMFNPENLIVFGYSFTWTQMQMIKDNLHRLKVTDRNIAVNIDIRY
ncbi:putative methyltransferase [Megamonas hypermegale]|uniref:Putative methyltransferase n=1 Tax=Megamonas hypermegale TaxID=158847 RepID=A0A239U3Q4_9FIRM|nr:site-specific DNA-methyltransferase [Megamonas hypermegale]SNV03714.1 putative methyltransferase [Megamonas hypermegale]